MKKLYKSHNKKLSGVLSGIAEYFNIDTTMVRVGFIFLLIFSCVFPAVIFYFLAAIIMENDPAQRHGNTNSQQSNHSDNSHNSNSESSETVKAEIIQD